MAAQIYILPGVERRDLRQDLGTEGVIQGAIDAGVDPIIIVGRDRSGSQFIASSIADADRVTGMLMAAATYIASSTVVPIEADEDAD